MRRNQWRQSASPGIDQQEYGCSREKCQETPCHVMPIENQREKTVLQPPPKSYNENRDPSSSGQRLETRQCVRLVCHLFCGRPDDPPCAQAVDHRPKWEHPRCQQSWIQVRLC